MQLHRISTTENFYYSFRTASVHPSFDSKNSGGQLAVQWPNVMTPEVWNKEGVRSRKLNTVIDIIKHHQKKPNVPPLTFDSEKKELVVDVESVQTMEALEKERAAHAKRKGIPL